LKRRLLDILVCPVCGEEFALEVHQEQERENFQPDRVLCQDRCAWKEPQTGSRKLPRDRVSTEDCSQCFRKEVIHGKVICRQRHRFPIEQGVLRILPRGGEPEKIGGDAQGFYESFDRHRKVKATFDLEWQMVNAQENIYGHSQAGEEGDFFRRMCIAPSYLTNKLLLDVGCGIGRLADRLSHRNCEVVGVELSAGIEKAFEQLGQNHRVHFIQGNLYSLPFRQRSFDYVYSKGVLQYVADAREALRQMARFVKPGGGVSITLYPPLPPFFARLNRGVRALTLRLPLPLVRVSSLLAVPFFSLAWKMSRVEERPISWKDRWHMIFNWLASDHQNFHPAEEVVSWFKEEGFSEIRLSPLPVGIFGRWGGHER
jgi:ubiquinone/menaquinone biosynthesis C-methylase UbiE/uncharacterized protein YbaR (Trm112 family)